MALQPGQHKLDAGHGTLGVHTFREGVAQKVGHDLILEVGSWSATLDVSADGSVTAISLEADPTSLQVIDGMHGLKPLSDKDRGDIRGNIDEKVLRRHPIGFRSSAVTASGSELTVAGELTLGGTTKPATLPVALGADGHLTATLPVVQSEFGIKPFRAMMGALKVRDSVEVVLDVRLPTA
jgi:hypothetical protein